MNILKEQPFAARLSGEEFPKSDKKLTEQVGAFFQNLGNKVVRRNFGEVILDQQGIRSSIAHGLGRKRAITFAAIPQVITNGIQIDYQRNWKGRNYDTFIFAAPVKIGEDTNYVGAVVIRNRNNNRYYLHEVVNENGEVIFGKRKRLDDSFKTEAIANYGSLSESSNLNNGASQVPNAKAPGFTSENEPASTPSNQSITQAGVDVNMLVGQNAVDNYIDYAYQYAQNPRFDKQPDNIEYAKPSKRLISDLAQEIDISDYTHALRDNDIRHIRNSHGENTPEQYPITKEDLKQIPDIVENYDEVVYVPKGNKQGIYYIKRHNGVTYYLEQVTKKYQNKKIISQ